MVKKLESLRNKEIHKKAEENAKNWGILLSKIEKASKSIGITTDEGIHFIDVFFGNKDK